MISNISIFKNYVFLMFFVFLLSLVSCKKTSPLPDGESNTEAPVRHNSENSLDWAGIYRGVLPCADCSGIEMTIELKDDGTFILQEKSLEGPENTKKFFSNTDEGKFHWEANGSKVVLDSAKNKRMFMAGEEALYLLDAEGKIIEGALANDYILSKVE